MIKKLYRCLILGASFLFASIAQAQDSDSHLQCAPMYECIYSYTINCEIQETYSTVLQIGKDFNRFYDYSAFAVDSLSYFSDAPKDEKDRLEERRLTSMYYFDSEIWQGAPNGGMTVIMEVSPNFMSYEESLDTMEWTLEEGTETICGYPCNKATTTYGGREWTVWYTSDIPTSAGPWKFNGLPGLVMAAQDSESLHEFSAITFRKGTIPVSKKNDATVFQSTRDKVLKSKLSAENDIKNGKMPNVSEVKFVDVHRTFDGKNIIYINGVARRPRPNGYQPLELK